MSQPVSRGKKAGAAAAMAIAIAAPAEGLRQWAYYCPAGILTVCYGHTGDVMRGRKYSLTECKALLDSDMQKAVDQVERCHPGLPDEVTASFADATLNLGSTIACNANASTAARYLYQGRQIDACNQLPRWNHATVAGVSVELPGLTKRRAQERELCLMGARS